VTALPYPEAMARARADYRAALGTVIEVSEIHGMIGCDSCSWQFDPPVRVIVLETPDGDLDPYGDGHVDPRWNVEPIEDLLIPSERRVTPPREARWLTVYGPSYEVQP
jgi:hypothetical protein